ncbi:head-tail connector protein [Bacillus amyloliquefaciens]|uniref:head-tail connector protein n=1 Tax=Bacillus amyloliquefaciens TaxID=1390 RepID=UPI00293F5DA7|nr:head-tail connector protein [Bacillus amyloliquefaciens]WOH96590.1 head-tail connector protein [Bacillus amyloliquefaciens]WOI51691.1 head-tail connector protein [Bacillus amyloliquefaciens]WOI67508.1 head-tail connector protein [Bacillus amyloliquefaciens]
MEHRLKDRLKEHLKLDDSEEDSLLSFYLKSATDYIKGATGYENDHLIVLLAGVFFEYRVTEKSMAMAVNSLTPLILAAEMSGENDGTEPG